MRKFFATVIIATFGTTVVGVGMAVAAEIEVSPASPPEGDAALTIEVTDFAPETPIYAVPCAIPAEGDAIDLTTAGCDIAEVATAVTDATGAATFVVAWTIPADGIAIYVGDEARAYEATQVLIPGRDDEGVDAPGVAVLGTSVVQEDLADTGPRETAILVLVAAIAIGIGAALRGLERFRTLS